MIMKGVADMITITHVQANRTALSAESKPSW